MFLVFLHDYIIFMCLSSI